MKRKREEGRRLTLNLQMSNLVSVGRWRRVNAWVRGGLRGWMRARGLRAQHVLRASTS